MTLTTTEDNTQYSLSCGYWTEVHYVLRRNKTLYVGVTYLQSWYVICTYFNREF